MGLSYCSHRALIGLSWGSNGESSRGALMALPWGCHVASVGLVWGCHEAFMRLLVGLPRGCYEAFMGSWCRLCRNADTLAVFLGSPPSDLADQNVNVGGFRKSEIRRKHTSHEACFFCLVLRPLQAQPNELLRVCLWSVTATLIIPKAPPGVGMRRLWDKHRFLPVVGKVATNLVLSNCPNFFRVT